ncbi:MAG: PKD domain-containing protein [Phaeodactylibacter sp.]|nr:PKD domain-containing protein [Phaeodactylibacter sp.]MCB9048750.1 PKD domain-containing protein [Lewinellaceae bacterium]
MKKTILLALASLTFCFVRAQENISGIINAYAAVQSIDYCNNTLLVSDASGFAEGGLLILIQMQGATIDVSNSAAYGSVTGLEQAGLYERAQIASINGLEFTLEKALLNDYDTDGVVQAVSLPNYPSGATVTATLTARAWDGSTGGILALETTTLNLQAPIDASGAGFRGGSAAINYTGDCSFLDNYNNYAYDASSIRAGRKGEGISIIDNSRARGRGSQANGGGGGNDHNSGGGGGGNVNGGGQGGENNNPSFFGCDGRSPGQGGKAISGVPFGRIFLGGGGGAGHGNNDVASDGGNGGGIILIQATDINPNGFAIRANGQSAALSAGDGAGGGGGGGTIVLALENGNGSGLLLEARGGRGGDTNNTNANQCFGPGGGGSGGRILRSGAAMATTDLAGGAPGVTTNSGSSGCPVGTNNAAAGNTGSAQNFERLPESDEDFAPYQLLAQSGDTSSCAGATLTLPASVQGSGLILQWQVDEGAGFTDLQSGLEYGPTNGDSLLINSVANAMDGNRYRLLISSQCLDTVFTDPLTLSVVPGPLAAFTYTVNGLAVSFDNTSSNTDSYSWDFGDGNSSTVFEPTHTFQGPGTYEVMLSATNNACGETASFTAQIQISLDLAPEAAFQPMPAAGCAPFSVLFSNTSTGGSGTTYQWFFPGGSPSTSTDGAPIVNYDNPGIFDVTLIASNSAGSDTLAIAGVVQAGAAPTADFGLVKDNLTITLSNLSSNADNYFWDFGDGNTSTASGPVHTYGAAGDYEVSLTVTNECGSDVSVLPVSVARRPTPLYSTENSASGCTPHTVYFLNESTGDYDSLRWDFPGGMPATSDIPNPEVLYNMPGQYSVQLTLFWLEGEEMLSQTQAINVLAGPVSDFDYNLDGLQATFTNRSTGATVFTWDFGDGAGSNETEPVHNFSSPGTYLVTLLASNSSCSDTASLEVTVQQVPVAAFQPMPAAGCTPLSVLFNNTSSGDATYQWFFPGGEPAASTDGAPIVNYNMPGEYTVTLIATNNAGSDTLTLAGAVQVGAPPTAGFELVREDLSITLVNLSVGADGLLWDFGDGNTSTTPNPAHTYSSSGDYEVSLTVTNDCGSDVRVLPVMVFQRPVPRYSTEGALNGCPPHTVYFVNTSTGDYDSLRWEFPGGTPSSAAIPNPEVVYDSSGSYSVQLTLFWPEGEETLMQPQAIRVLERPQPAFTFELNGLTATFFNLSTNATDFTWNFGDGTTSNEENPVHTFPAPGNYDVTLNASNQGECTRANGQNVYIQPNGVSEASLPESVQVFPNPTIGTLRLQSAHPGWYPVQWRWLNLQGQVMASGQAHQDRQWNLEAWPAGAYLLQLFNAEGWWTVRVVRY